MKKNFETDVWELKQKKKSHLYYHPHFLLRDRISHYTVSITESFIIEDGLNIIPDASGCIVMSLRSGSWHCTIWGPTTETVVVNNDEDIPLRLFAEFLPGTIHRLLGCSAEVLRNQCIPLNDFDPELDLRLTEILESADSAAGAIEGFNRLFLSLMDKGRSDLWQKGEEILWEVQKSQGMLTVNDIARATHYSSRHLSRISAVTLGMTMKQYIRLVKINIALQEMKKGTESLTGLAHGLKYYDQSHFIHDFKSICGVTPMQYLKSRSDFYNEEFKF